MDFIHPSRCSKIGCDLGSIHQNGCLWQEKKHIWWLGTNTSQTPVTATLSLLLTKFTLHWFMLFLLFCSLQHKTCSIVYFFPKIKCPWGTHWVSHPAALATRYTVVLEQRQSYEWACLFPWEKGVRHLSVFEDSYLGSLLRKFRKFQNGRERDNHGSVPKSQKIYFSSLPCSHLLTGLVAHWWRSATVTLKCSCTSYSFICNIS